MITITDSAKKKFMTLLESNNAQAIYFGVKSGGCSGFTYDINLIRDLNDATDLEVSEINGVKFAIDPMSVMYILGTEINWKEDIMGACFEFKNPLEQTSCGCGTSFSV